jgi:hypothetical protein
MPRGRPKGSKNKNTKVSGVVPVKRPRKLKNTQSTDIQTFETFEEESEVRLDKINPFEITIESCECKFEPINEWSNLVQLQEDAKKKLGSYSSCRLPIKNARKVYPVVAYIQTDLNRYRSSGYTDKQIYVGCINYLSKNQSNNKLKRLGELYPYSFSIVNDKISAMFLTTEQKSKMFWGEGNK